MVTAKIRSKSLQKQARSKNCFVLPENKKLPMGSIAHSHHMAGDARASLDLRGVFLDEANSTLPEIPPRNTCGVRRNIIKFT